MTHPDFLAQRLAAFFDTAPKTRLIRFIRGERERLDLKKSYLMGKLGSRGGMDGLGTSFGSPTPFPQLIRIVKMLYNVTLAKEARISGLVNAVVPAKPPRPSVSPLRKSCDRTSIISAFVRVAAGV